MPAQWRCGYAETDITPTPGEALPSGFGRERYAQSALSPLIAQAIALEDARGQRAVIVASDVLGYSRVLVDAMRTRIQDRYGLGPEAVTFPCSHTHCGPAVSFGLNFAVGGLNVWYLVRLEDALVELVGKSLENLGPATISLTEADCQIGMNRRLLDGDRVLHQPNPDGVYDRHTPILRIKRRRTPSDVILVSHACHPTSTGAYDRWSPDWPGAMRRRIATRLKGSRVLFGKGCGADANVVHRDPETGAYVFSRSPARARAAGIKLADRVLRALEREPTLELDPQLSMSMASGGLTLKRGPSKQQIRELALEGDNQSHLTWWARQSLSYPDSRKTVDYEVQAWRLGRLKMFWLEGEVCADLGISLRRMTEGPTATIAYSNTCPGYISSARLIREGGYEGDTSHKAYFLPAPFAEKSEGEFVRICAKALKALEQSA